MVIQYQNRQQQIQDLLEEEGSISNVLYTNPLVLSKDDKDIIEVADNLLPFSIGFEIECDQLNSFNLQDFINIPNILDINIDSSEQRFRIPNGLNGFKCLYNISMMLYKNSLENKGSGIHYHIDCTSYFEKITQFLIVQNKEGILKELDDWGYHGTYNNREFLNNMGHNWLRVQPSFKTIECRIGEMTFDYKLLLKRMIHLSQIFKEFKYICELSHLNNNRILYDKDIYKILQNRTKKI